MTDLVLSETRGPVRHVVLNRPEKRNAFDAELVAATGAALRAAAADPAVRVVVRARRRAGSSRRGWTSPRWPSSPRSRTACARSGRERLEAWNAAEEMPKPVVCAIHGACLGGAMELALACDLRVMAADAVIGMPETRIGLIPDVGGSSRLPQLVGLGRAKELVLTGRVIGAEEAERIGLVTRVAPPDGLEQAVDGLVGELLACAPVAVGLAKRVLDASARPALAATLELEVHRAGALRAHGRLRRGGAGDGGEAPAVVRGAIAADGLPGRSSCSPAARAAPSSRAGMLDVAGEDLVVIANTGDDVEVYGGLVSPDPDLVTFWLADRIDARGWGLRRRHLRGDGRSCASSARTSGSTSATATSRSACGGRERLAAGARPTEVGRRAAARARRAGAGAADGRLAGAHVGARAGGVARLPGRS